MAAARSFATISPAATVRAGELLADALAPGDTIVLTGDLGAGKTQLTKGIAAGLGVTGPITSPTFNILLVHEGRLPLYHFDLYRLTRAAELEDIDYFATIEGDGVSVVEWGDRFSEAAPADGLVVALRITGDAERRVEIEPLGPRGVALAAAWRLALDGDAS